MKELEINQKLEIEIKSGSYAGNYLSKVADFLEEGIIITGLYREGAPLPVRLNRSINVYYTTDRAAYKFKSKVLKRTNKPIPLLLIEKSDNVKRIQRRNYFRLEVSGTVGLYQLPEEGEAPRKLTTARLLDISGGGLRLQTKLKFEKGEEIMLALENILSPDDFIKAEIVRSKRENENLFDYGTEFLEIEEEQREEIIQWIFSYQRKNRKKGLR